MSIYLHEIIRVTPGREEEYMASVSRWGPCRAARAPPDTRVSSASSGARSTPAAFPRS